MRVPVTGSLRLAAGPGPGFSLRLPLSGTALAAQVRWQRHPPQPECQCPGQWALSDRDMTKVAPFAPATERTPAPRRSPLRLRLSPDWSLSPLSRSRAQKR